ncbi:hypothetical protein IMSAGC004_01451 [Bacteroidaceae bacterium]|uniref:hypothetical protein n=2 Tax=uncultured Phocaeicola sp. TaxID=990718 RepID=UPI001433B3AA|nr:hypothetical protein [uncultured Phocaeicola sp.]GFH99049.1 hypothetical protein IMSAGC004_01451 [Bacteroidaceae bacterium]
MCKKDYSTIIAEVDEHMKKSGKRYYSNFYVGVSDNAVQRLFSEHHVSREESWWIYRTAKDADTARKVEKHYLDLGMRGGDEDRNDSSTMVYVYAVEPITTE